MAKKNEIDEESSHTITQLEYYLSDWNIRKDEFLKKKINESLGGCRFIQKENQKKETIYKCFARIDR
ncbi:hypothetical protein AYI69_g6300 [Smittium culicis]|uniref:HTH La-type RNA-binding domain-containing protein n=1 Tax=Smittium culicis TaxID=133412 RepID=A0A1R1XZU6_9FUNG|nr:hypothetical protein AYI69_g6300 [Smittium culicis]